MPREPYRPVERTELLRPVAAPVDSFVRAQEPSRDSSLQDLARSLSVLGGSLGGLVGQRDKEAEEADRLRGEAEFHRSTEKGFAEAVAAGIVPAQSSQAFMRGWKKAQGDVAGGQILQQFDAAYSQWPGKTSSDPQAYDKFLSEFLRERINTNDPDILAGINPRLRQLSENYLHRHIGDASKAATQGLLDAAAAQDSQALEAANTAGLASRRGTDYEAVFRQIEANREAKLKIGANAQDYDQKVVVDGVTAAAIQLRDPKILDFMDRKVPGKDYAWSNTPYGREQRQKTIDTLETMGRRSIADDEKRRREEKAELKETVTRDTIQAITKDPRAPVPEDLLARGEKVDPDFRINVIRWRDAVAKEGQTSDPEELLAVTSDILNGGGLRRVQRAMDDRVFKNREDLTQAWKLAESMKEHGGKLDAVTKLQSFRDLTATIKKRTATEKDLSATFDDGSFSDEFAGQIAAAKGGDGLGGIRSDAFQDRLIQQRVAIYGYDPEALMGSLQLAGRNADRLVADVAAADLITLRASQDAQNLADRIRLGLLEEFGGDLSAAMSALRAHYQVAATARAESAAMVANAARTLRRQRAEFAYTPEDVAAMARLSDAQMLTLIEAAGRDPRVADRLLRRGFWSRLGDDASYLYVNNLLWGLRTHFVNLSTNLYMLGARPLERMIGGAIQGDRVRVAANARQYAYMAGSLTEAWRDAVRTWQTGDSILSPHSSELSAATTGRSVNWVAEPFKQADSIPNVLSNAYVGFMKAAGLPTRALGAVDELVKQTVYRSKVMADAHGTGIAAGLEGPALSEHVRRALDAAFDDAGRAVDLKALDEAHIATFQQDLLPGTFGARVQGFVGDSAALRIIVPFIRTPTNVLRMGWKLTPGLNLAQKEYRLMLRGEMGPEAQAQAMGQMAMGSLFLGVAGLLTHAGFITGGGPSDPNLKRQLMATGWQPYSFVVPGADGVPTYINFGRFDPIAMPFGIMADVVDILERDHDGDGFGEQATAALGGVFLSVVKQLGQKTYLTALNDTITAIVEPDRGLQKAAGKTAANFVPFASGLRFANPDPLMRETRGIVDSIMATVPGLSERLPARRDLFGDPLTVHKGLWVHGKDGLVDAEVRRMIDQAGVGPFGAPSYQQRGVDLRT